MLYINLNGVNCIKFLIFFLPSRYRLVFARVLRLQHVQPSGGAAVYDKENYGHARGTRYENSEARRSSGQQQGILGVGGGGRVRQVRAEHGHHWKT
jgi:hypothetical protein